MHFSTQYVDPAKRTVHGKFLIIGCMLSSAIGIYIGITSASPLNTKPALGSPGTNSDTPVLVGELRKGTPKFPTVLPEGKKIEDFGGWTLVSPPNRDPVFAYVDMIGSIPINVSEQPMPKDFKDDPDDQVRDLANGFGATTVVEVNNVIVYIGTSAKGPQSVIFRKNDILILIKASAAIPNNEWQTYVQSLS